MTYFTKEFLAFFKGLEHNNRREWFDAHRTEYESTVKKPFQEFVGTMIGHIQKFEPSIRIDPKDAIFRINRDVRFSKDKRPYNTHVSANISPVGKKSKEIPGFYFQLSVEGIMIAGGIYQTDPGTLAKVRSYLVKHLDQFEALVSEKKFKQAYGTIQGERSKRVPEGFVDAAKRNSMIANKQFFFMKNLPPSRILKKDLPDVLMEYYEAGMELNQFLRRALK